MAKRYMVPQQDTGWGLIYRLNDLFRRIEVLAPVGRYEEWNFALDRVWCNLLYRNDIKILKNEEGEIKSIHLNDEDTKDKNFLDKQITIAKFTINKLKKEKEVDVKEMSKAKKDYYDSLMLKDVWIRKFMNSLGLYLKQVEHDPGKAIYGN